MTDEETPKPVGVGYIRVSQERAALTGYGLQSQEADVRKHAEYRGINLFHIYRENGQSGYDRERPELVRMLEDAKAGRFEVVIFPSIDRAGRSVKDIIEIEMLLRKHGIDVVFVREGVDTSTPVGELFRNVMASIAQFEGRLIYERLYKGKLRKMAEGGYIGGWLPYGYRAEAGRVLVIPEEAEIVERIFNYRVRGDSFRRICAKLNKAGSRGRQGRPWWISSIRKILMNRFYTGRVEFEGELVRAQHDAIISDILFDKCRVRQ